MGKAEVCFPAVSLPNTAHGKEGENETRHEMREGKCDHVRGWREIIEVREIELIRDVRGEMERLLDF